MKDAAVLLICTLLATQSSAQAEQVAPPVIQLEPAKVSIDRLQDGRRLVRLPSIEFELQLTPACGPDQSFHSLSISIADTRRTFGAAEFTANARIETRLRVSGRQIGPLAVDDFCAVSTSPGDAVLRIGAAFTAAISVRCDAGSQQKVTYDSLPLDLELHCNVPGVDGNATARAAEQREKFSFPL